MTMKPNFAIFETAIGPCGIIWGEHGIVGVQLPEATEGRTRARLQKRFRDAVETPPPANVATTIENIVALLDGRPADFSTAKLDIKELPEFNRQVYEIISALQPGETMTYGDIAKRLGKEPQAARDVGQALGENPIPVVIPCHRVLAANGRPGGYSGSGGVRTKLKLLTIEGAQLSDEPSLFERLPLEARTDRQSGK
jgi:methylated-DNA-[protein]-cysteine S-methyltransferase